MERHYHNQVLSYLYMYEANNKLYVTIPVKWVSRKTDLIYLQYYRVPSLHLICQILK